MFQSLLGFKINWNGSSLDDELDGKLKFQSLLGFKINWNRALLGVIQSVATDVSIPIRV